MGDMSRRRRHRLEHRGKSRRDGTLHWFFEATDTRGALAIEHPCLLPVQLRRRSQQMQAKHPLGVTGQNELPRISPLDYRLGDQQALRFRQFSLFLVEGVESLRPQNQGGGDMHDIKGTCAQTPRVLFHQTSGHIKCRRG